MPLGSCLRLIPFGPVLAIHNDDESQDRRAPVGLSQARRPSGKDARQVLAGGVVVAACLSIAVATGRSGYEAATLALAAGAAFAASAALLRGRERDRHLERLGADLDELAEAHRLTLAGITARKPEPIVLFAHEGGGVERIRVARQRPRPLDIAQTIAHERTLALRTLPAAKAPLAGTLKIYRDPTEHDRDAFREQVERYAANLHEALEEYDAYRKERALLVSGRFRFENGSDTAAHNVTVRAYFPDPFEVVRRAPWAPAIPRRPAFRGRRAGLTALLGGEARGSVHARESGVSRAAGNVSRPRYLEGSAIVEVSVESLRRSAPADMADDDRWILRLPRPGEYRIRWEATSAELDDPVEGELRIEVVELLDATPICSVKELLSEDGLGPSYPDPAVSG